MKQVKTLAALMMLTVAFGLTSCGDKKTTESAEEEAVAKFEVPADAQNIKVESLANGKDVTAEKLVVGKDQWFNDNSFKDNTSVREIYMTKDFQFFGKNSFEGHKQLEKLASEGKVPVFNDYAFTGCTALKQVYVDVETIGLETFKGCTALEEVVLGNSLYWLRESCFEGCSSLRKFLPGITLSKVEPNMFKGCTALEEVGVHGSALKQMFEVFQQCPNIKTVYLLSLEAKTFPEGVTIPCEQIDLYVLDASLPYYQSDAQWSKFKSIKPMSESPYYNEEGWFK